MEQAHDRQDHSGFTLRSKTQPQGSDHRKCHTETTADRAQATGKATAVDSRRSGAIRVVGQIDRVLAASVTYYPARHVVRWHRDLFRRYWQRKSKSEKREPCTSPETIEFIQQMARENRLWGAERIRGELLKLGVKVSKRTIQKYMLKERRSRSGQTWSTFLKNHFRDIWACDFTVVNDLLFRSWYVFVIMEPHTRRIVHAAVTSIPIDEWVA
jgi:hypothetical protein